VGLLGPTGIGQAHAQAYTLVRQVLWPPAAAPRLDLEALSGARIRPRHLTNSFESSTHACPAFVSASWAVG
jgi:hypothetical protein